MIVSMKRMTLVAHKADEAGILSALQTTRAVEVISGGQENGALAALERAQRFAEAGADILFVEAVTRAEEIRALPQRLPTPQLMNMVIGGKTPIVDAAELGRLGYGLVLYANAALQGALAGMQQALTALRDTGQVLESSGLVTPFAERQRLVGKPRWDALEQCYR